MTQADFNESVGYLSEESMGCGCSSGQGLGCGCEDHAQAHSMGQDVTSQRGMGAGRPTMLSRPGGFNFPGMVPAQKRGCTPAAACPELPPGWPNTVQGRKSWALVHQRYKEAHGLKGLGAVLSPISWTKPVDTDFDTTQAVRLPNRRYHHPQSYRTHSESLAVAQGPEDTFAGDYGPSLAVEAREGLYGDAVNVDGHFGTDPVLVAAEPFAEQRVVNAAFQSESMPLVEASTRDVMMTTLQAQEMLAASQGDATAALQRIQAEQGGYIGPLEASAVQATAPLVAGKYTAQDLAFGAAIAFVLYSMLRTK